MQELSSAPLPEESRSIRRADRTALVLKVHAVQLDMLANYEHQLLSTVFVRTPTDCDAKLSKKYRRTLLSSDAFKVLSIIWKESSFVTDEALAEAGLTRAYKANELTAHRLAADLTEDTHEVAKFNSRIRTIGMAAASYELTDRALVHSTRVILKGTDILHQFMTDLSAKNILAMARFVPLSPTISPIAKAGGR